MGLGERLAQFVAETEFESIPGEAATQAKRALLDTLGVTLAGCREEGSDIVAQWVRQQGAVQEASVLGHGFRTTAVDAALANGTSGHALDYDDVNVSMRGHPSIPLVPAVLALGEKLAASGRQVITAFVLGFEVEAKAGRAIGGPHYALGWHPTATLGSLGSAAACARLLRLDAQKTAVALAIAASLASGLRQNFGTMTKPLHAGLAARNGITAAELAGRGFSADPQALEGPNGFFRAFTGGDRFDPTKVVEALGDPFDIVSPGIGVKLYPCCYATHRSLDAVLELRQGSEIPLGEIDYVEVGVSRGTLLPLIAEAPTMGLQGKFNLAYCLASALVDGKVTLDSFSDEAVLRPQVQALMAKVRTVEAAEEGPGPIAGWASVRIRLNNGRERSLRVDVPKGDPRRPLSWEELVAKFDDCTRPLLPEEERRQAVELIANLDSLDDVGALMGLLGLTRAKAAG